MANEITVTFPDPIISDVVVDKIGPSGIGSSAWGTIAGTLSNQSDLQTVLNSKVPTSTTVNGHSLTGNVTVTASDVGLGNVENATASTLYVPLVRTVNGHALSSNITITNSDIGSVPTSTTVNGHPLSSNITVTRTDLGFITDTNLSGGTVLTVATAYYDTFSSNRTLTFTGTPAAGDLPITLVANVTTSLTIGFPASTDLTPPYSTSLTSRTYTTGVYELSWRYSGGRWVFADSFIGSGGGISGLNQHFGVYGASSTTLASSGTLYASSYSSFSSAITSIGSTISTLVIDAVMAVPASVTVPLNVTLRFEGLGQLNISNSQTVLINGGIIAAPSMHIFAGAGTVTFYSGSTPQSACPVMAFYPQWWGVVGDGTTDDTVAMQAAFDAMANGFHMVLTPWLKIKNSGLVISGNQHGIWNFSLTGMGSIGQADDYSPQFIYAGTPGGTHITWAHTRGCLAKGFTMYDYTPGGTQANGAGIGMWLTQDVFPSSAGGLSSDNSFEDIEFHPSTYSGGWIGVKIFTTGDNNNEYHRFKHIIFNGIATPPTYSTGGIGINILGAQPKQIKVDECQFVNLAVGIGSADSVSSAGSIRCHNNSFSCGICYNGPFVDANEASGDDSEGSNQILVNPTAPFTLAYGRYEAIRGGQTATSNTTISPVISVSTGNTTRIIGNTFVGYGTLLSNWISGGSGLIVWEGNSVGASTDLTGLDTFQRKLSDMDINGRLGFELSNKLNLSQAQMQVSSTIGNPQAGRTVYKLFNGSTPVTLTGFDNTGTNFPNGTIIYLIGDGFCSIANNATIATNSGSTIPPFNGKMTSFYLDGTVWRQIGSGP